MGEAFVINRDGSVTQSTIKTINSVEWIDFKDFKGKHSFWQYFYCVLCLFPMIGWGLGILTYLGVKIGKGYWPFFGIRAIENTSNPIKVYCDKKGNLGLYTKKHRITNAKYGSIQVVPSPNYPTFILEQNRKFCLYNFTQGKILFPNSERITYLGDNAVIVVKGGKSSKYSLIGMRLE